MTANELAVPYEHSTIRQFHMVLAIWSNLRDYPISVPPFG